MNKKFLLFILSLLICMPIFAQEYRKSNGLPGKDYWQNKASYVINANLSEDLKTIDASQVVTYFNNSPDNLDSLVFNLYNRVYSKDIFNIKSVVVGKKAAKFRLDGTKMIVYLSKSLQSKKNLQIMVDWTIKFKSIYERAGVYSTGVFWGYWYPQIAVYDDVNGWDKIQHSKVEEFYFEFADYDVTINTSSKCYVMSTGLLQNSSEIFTPEVQEKFNNINSDDKAIINYKDNYLKNTTNAWHFVINDVSDFSFVVSNNSHLWAKNITVNQKTYNVFSIAKPFAYEDFNQYICQGILDYSTISAPKVEFPFSQVVTFFNDEYGGGAMEFPGMINTANCESKSDYQFTLLHELAHMYAPFLAGFNQAREGFMDEGFAMLFPALMPSRLESVSLFDNLKGDFLTILGMGSDGSLADFKQFYKDSLTKESYTFIKNKKGFGEMGYYANSYNKSYHAYYWMRDAMGSQKFEDLVSNFFASWAKKHPTAKDWLNAVRDANNGDFDWYINAWYYSVEIPNLAIDKVDKTEDKLYITINNVSKIPVPLKIAVFNKEENDKYSYKTQNMQTKYLDASIWKDKNSIKLEFNKMTYPFTIELGDKSIPDCERKNNNKTINN